MKVNIKFKKIIAILILMIILGSTTAIYAADSKNTVTIEKISNPDAGAGEVDGLVTGGDRETSYAWAMATRGDYIYIGTNKNIIGNVAQTFIKTMTGSFGVSEDVAWGIVSSITNGDVPRPTTE